jgi:signal transduction histidine kinase
MPPTSSKTIEILQLEDSRADAELLKAMLRSEGLLCRVHCVRTRPDFEAALAHQRFDLILSDHTLPGFDGLSALALAKSRVPECPFIFVSGTLREEVALEALKEGAVDYVLKDRPARLASAIQRALRDAAQQAIKRDAEEKLKRSHEELHALTERLISSREEERIRISRELHDGFGAMLTSIEIGLNWIKTAIEGLPSEVLPTKESQNDTPSRKQLIDKISQLDGIICDTTLRIRKLCTELRPSILDDLGLVAALEWQVGEFQERTGIRCELATEMAEVAVSAQQATAVFRIFQEILTNVARHSQASKVKASLKQKGSILVLEVKDNGIGIRPDRLTGTGSLGLLGMQERASLARGQLQIRGEPGKGTTVSLSVPLES